MYTTYKRHANSMCKKIIHPTNETSEYFRQKYIDTVMLKVMLSLTASTEKCHKCLKKSQKVILEYYMSHMDHNSFLFVELDTF